MNEEIRKDIEIQEVLLFVSRDKLLTPEFFTLPESAPKNISALSLLLFTVSPPQRSCEFLYILFYDKDNTISEQQHCRINSKFRSCLNFILIR